MNDEESLFYYASGLGVANFSNPTHMPIFLDDIDNATLQEAIGVCGSSLNIECIFDFSQTRNAEIARETQSIMEQNEANQRAASNDYV